MTINSTDPQAPVTDEELDQMIWKLEREGMTPKMLSLMRELRQWRKAAAEPVADVVAWSYPNEERACCDIRWRKFNVAPGPLFTAPSVPTEMNSDKAWGELKISAEDCQAWSEGWNACRAATLRSCVTE